MTFKQCEHKTKSDCSNIDQNFFVYPRSCLQAKNGFQQHPADLLEFFFFFSNMKLETSS